MAANFVQMDAELIGALFLISNQNNTRVRNGTSGTGILTGSPTAAQVAQAKIDLHNSATTATVGEATCNPCTVNGQKYYGLTQSQCLAMGGACGHGGLRRHRRRRSKIVGKK